MSIIGPSSVTVQDEGTTVAHTNKINFTGSHVSATYDSVNHRVTVDFTGGGGGGGGGTWSNIDGGQANSTYNPSLTIDGGASA